MQETKALDFEVLEKSQSGIEILNSANFNAAGATLGIRQKPGGRFNLKVRVPKVRDRVVRVTVEVADEFKPFIKTPRRRVIRAKRRKKNISFFLRVKRSINNVIPTGSTIEVPITMTDLANGGQEEFVILVRN